MSLIKKQSHLGGTGTFTDLPIKKLQLIKTITGKKLSIEQVINKIDSGEENLDDPFQIDEGIYLDLDEDSRLINHSCNPNCGITLQTNLIALRDIKANEELTYDYSTVVGTDVIEEAWTMQCSCKGIKCRKTIGNVLTIPNDQLDNYLHLRALPSFILKQLKYI